MPSFLPCRSIPTVCCQPPLTPSAAPPARPTIFIRRSSAGMCRASARMSPQVSSAVDVAEPPVPHTVTPCKAAAARSIDEFDMPVVTSSRSRGSWLSRDASKNVRSRIATITSYGSSARTSSSVDAMCLANTSISAIECTADQSVLARETC